MSSTFDTSRKVPSVRSASRGPCAWSGAAKGGYVLGLIFVQKNYVAM